ncbi:uncharacterized protein DDB_G0284459-like [Lethenteron reissneri]|uniref:uncharacterized protein DDB_G0284459-like n=1 Tax=Lethenteron reissneri TaxID=7753 RepID=UPI002AB77410|nr:uncharacterized protein DDB_G0284459-like [Lethenteron reissneri]XP_061405220.1 uncharacterized protein DDB_G0284459-like [Lethenteron reissneri]
MNDSIVQLVDTKAVMSEQAYMLFYIRSPELNAQPTDSYRPLEHVKATSKLCIKRSHSAMETQDLVTEQQLSSLARKKFKMANHPNGNNCRSNCKGDGRNSGSSCYRQRQARNSRGRRPKSQSIRHHPDLQAATASPTATTVTASSAATIASPAAANTTTTTCLEEVSATAAIASPAAAATTLISQQPSPVLENLPSAPQQLLPPPVLQQPPPLQLVLKKPSPRSRCHSNNSRHHPPIS